MSNVLRKYKDRLESRQSEQLDLEQYLELCKTEPLAYASTAERMLVAIGEKELVDTRHDERLSRIFSNRKIYIYPAFKDFYGMEDTIDEIVSYYRHAAQGLEEAKQVLYLLGPVGGGKSSLAERLKKIFERVPFYALKERGGSISPVFESPLGLFDKDEDGPDLLEDYGIPPRYLGHIMSPWAVQVLEKHNGDIDKAFEVVKLWPSVLKQIGITKVEPGDENTQDIASLVGKVNIRMLEDYDQKDPRAYGWAGGLNLTTQGIMEFVEMFKAPIKMLHPMLTATQEGHYNGTEQFGAIPYQGCILAHCFSEDTELLTNEGWKGIDDVNLGDIVATLNRDSNQIEYQPTLNKFVYEGVDEMYHMSSSAADHLVTANHNMIYESYGTWKESLAEDLFIKGAKLPVSGVLEREDWNFYENDDELRFHIWCITDGSVHYVRKTDGLINYRFHFKKERKINRLLEILTNLNYKYEITQKYDNTTYIYVKSVSPKFTKLLTESHRLLSPRQTDILFLEWSQSDGTRYSHSRENGFQLQTNVPFHRDMLQELAVISGHKSTAAVGHKEGYDPVYVLSIRMNTQTVRCDSVNKGTVEYNGRVWCLETKNHTVIARRNGKVLITGNSNMSEWTKFKENKNNEAFLDRIYIVKVPYCLRATEEEQIYKKLIANSRLRNAPCAPGTMRMIAEFSIMTRLKEHENSSLYSKMEIYDGKNLKDKDPKAKSLTEYKETAGIDEGMWGSSTRFAYKTLSKVYNYDPEEIAANPIHLMYVLERQVEREGFSKEQEEAWIGHIKNTIAPKFAEFIGEEIQKSYLESYSEYGQNLFDRYLQYADFWIQERDYRDPDTGESFNKEALNAELEKIEKPAGIVNPKDFRNEVVNFTLRQKANLEGRNPDWTSYEKLRTVIEKKMFANTEEILPVISFTKKGSQEESDKHEAFVDRMVEKGYTKRQVRLLVEWYLRYRKHN